MKDALSMDEMRQDMGRMLKELATPVDFDYLVAKGILKKSGAWFVPLKINELPPHAWKQIMAIEADRNGVVVKLKFRKSTKQAQVLYKKLTGKSL